MRGFLLLTLLIALAVWPAPLHAEGGGRLRVSSEGPYTTVQAALADAQDGDIIEVHGGVYAAPLEITRRVSLIGVDGPVIDGGGQGSLLIISAPDVTVQGFTLRNSGSVLDHEDTGIIVQAPRAVIADNVLEEVLFGIYFANADDGVARHNVIHGQDLDPPLRGDGIRVWYSAGVVLSGNEVSHTRDTLIWYADDITIEDSHFSDNRYGLHFMYSSNALVQRNVFENNSIGTYLMYSTGLTVRDNTMAYNRGPSGYGLALKDMDRVVATDNVFVGNRTGVFLDNSPSAFDVYNTFSGNFLAYNDIGVAALPAVQRNVFQGNSFLENGQQASTRGRGTLQGNVWHQGGQGNYWSDYVGYDEDGNGIGEMPYRAEQLFESLADEHPVLRLFAYSPAAQAVDFAAAAFPSLRPEPRLVDEAPLMRYVLPPQLATRDTPVSLPFLAVSLALVGLGGGLSALGFWRRGRPAQHEPPHAPPTHSVGITEVPENNMIVAEALTKRYGDLTALDHVSFAIRPGEAVALWGENGAGKTTALRCLLGVLPFEGRLTVNGCDVRRQGKAARAAIGYVPQEAAFYDLTAWETLRFYARLKKVPTARIEAALDQVQLADHADKPVRALSGGMKQRLALAVALLSDPPLLVLDEPTANLDARSRRDFLRLVQALNKAGKTVVFSSHRLDEVMALAGRVLVLEDGRLTLTCPPTDLAEKLELRQWLRIRVPSVHWDNALRLLHDEGFAPTPNAYALYVQVGVASKMLPLRALEAARIPVEDFDVLDGDLVVARSAQDETQ